MQPGAALLQSFRCCDAHGPACDELRKGEQVKAGMAMVKRMLWNGEREEHKLVEAVKSI